MVTFDNVSQTIKEAYNESQALRAIAWAIVLLAKVIKEKP